MSDYAAPSGGGDDETGCPCCASLTPFQRKLGYYITFIIAFALFVFGTIGIFGQILGDSSSPLFLAFGGLTIILNPLWIKSCGKIWEEMKQPIRWTSSLIFMLSIALLLVSKYLLKEGILVIVFSVLTILSGIWYFLSYFENGQKACVACVKNCCCPDKDNGGA